MSGKNWRGLGCAAVIGAAIAFPVGFMVASLGALPGTAGPSVKAGGLASQPLVRNVYSPTIFNDPYFIDQERKVVEALEAQCRHQREHCADAKQARGWLDRQRPAK